MATKTSPRRAAARNTAPAPVETVNAEIVTVSARAAMDAASREYFGIPYGKSARDILRRYIGVGAFTSGRNWTPADIRTAAELRTAARAAKSA